MKIRRLIYRTPLYILFICFFLSAKIHFFSHSLSVNHKKNSTLSTNPTLNCVRCGVYSIQYFIKVLQTTSNNYSNISLHGTDNALFKSQIIIHSREFLIISRVSFLHISRVSHVFFIRVIRVIRGDYCALHGNSCIIFSIDYHECPFQ